MARISRRPVGRRACICPTATHLVHSPAKRLAEPGNPRQNPRGPTDRARRIAHPPVWDAGCLKGAKWPVQEASRAERRLLIPQTPEVFNEVLKTNQLADYIRCRGGEGKSLGKKTSRLPHGCAPRTEDTTEKQLPSWLI